jgi:hypothetical protein
MTKLSIIVLLFATVCIAQDCPNVDQIEQMKAAVIAGHGKGAYFEVNGCHWLPGKNPRDLVGKIVPPTSHYLVDGISFYKNQHFTSSGQVAWMKRNKGTTALKAVQDCFSNLNVDEEIQVCLNHVHEHQRYATKATQTKPWR